MNLTFRRVFLLILCLFGVGIHRAGVAFVDVRLLTPREGFRVGDGREVVTNDSVLRLEGDVLSDGGDIFVTLETPAGVPRLEAMELPVDTLTVDIGAVETVAELILEPVLLTDTEGVRSYGVRTLTLSTSDNGQTYRAPISLSSPSGVAAPDEKAHIPLPEGVRGRFLRLEWRSGWQRDIGTGRPDIRLKDIEAVAAGGKTLQARLVRVGLTIFGAESLEPFVFSILLKEGKNLVTVEAEQRLPNEEDGISAERSDFAAVTITYLPELPQPDETEQPSLILSDGEHLIVTIPPKAPDATMRGLRLIRQNPTEISLTTYAANRSIRPGSRPILAYRFEGRFQTAFRAEATASLPGQPPSLAVDGRREFPSTWISNLAPMPIRLRVDLDAEARIGRIVVYPRRDGNISYGPQRARILVSTDNENFALAAEVTTFADAVTTIPLPATPTARWVEFVIEEGKQANNIQLNEIEFFDPAGTRILAQVTGDQILFAEPIRLELRYILNELKDAGIAENASLGVFLWHPQAKEWQWTGVSPVAAQTPEGMAEGAFTLELNTLSPLAVFELVPGIRRNDLLAATWTANPFSPNGDGRADTTRLFVRLREESADTSEREPPEVTVRLYDYRAKLVRTLADRTPVPSRALMLEWDGTDRNGRPVPIGAYFCQVVLDRNLASGRQTTVRTGMVAVVR